MFPETLDEQKRQLLKELLDFSTSQRFWVGLGSVLCLVFSEPLFHNLSLSSLYIAQVEMLLLSQLKGAVSATVDGLHRTLI